MKDSSQKPAPETEPSSKIELLKQFIKFGIVGASNTLISLAIYYLFVAINPNLYMVGNIVGFIVSVANSFFWNNRFVFKSENNDWKSIVKRLLRTYVAYGFTFILSSALLYLQVDILGVSTWLAPLIGLVVTIPLNFIINKLWAYKK
ncbi:GtrA family protein [Ruminococcaceae bacterium OttesenSCG-928-A16]|nr:GtrA family protein [Ruminococcaceae bacterium OttesenSCG-928-A16]